MSRALEQDDNYSNAGNTKLIGLEFLGTVQNFSTLLEV